MGQIPGGRESFSFLLDPTTSEELINRLSRFVALYQPTSIQNVPYLWTIILNKYTYKRCVILHTLYRLVCTTSFNPFHIIFVLFLFCRATKESLCLLSLKIHPD